MSCGCEHRLADANLRDISGSPSHRSFEVTAIAAQSHIVADPSIRGGRPRLANSRITVADVVLMHLRLGQSLEELAGKLDLSLASLHAAMAYYNDHQTDIDRSLHEDAAFEQAFRHDNPSPLGEKLSVLRHRG